MVQETVEPPPPLITIDTNQMSLAVKRGLSPNSSPILTQKKLCSLSFRQRQMLSSQASGDGHLALLQPQQQQAGGVRLLTTPYAPTMQQLLISKEPITVRGRHSGGLTAHQSSNNDSRHSVLRNLLVSGRDESAGYSVLAPASPLGATAGSTATPPGTHKSSDDAKERKVQGQLHNPITWDIVFFFSFQYLLDFTMLWSDSIIGIRYCICNLKFLFPSALFKFECNYRYFFICMSWWGGDGGWGVGGWRMWNFKTVIFLACH